MVELKWAPVVSVSQINYIKIPVNQINPNAQFEEANEILRELKSKYRIGTFLRTKSGGLAKNVKNIVDDQFEITSKSKFELVQRIMFLSKKCKVLYPKDFKSDIIATLKKMKEGYLEKY